jgi:hypothetical protein
MAKKWVHPDFRFEVQQRFLKLCQFSPDAARQNSDALYNLAKEEVQFTHKCKWIDFMHKHGIGVFK